ncbi:MAG: hypothetical protein J1F06_00965 [Prevotellaceae bacterium]|nr:hypothetical protein [Prevotellaceae bacterium]
MKKIFTFIVVSCLAFTASQAQIYTVTSSESEIGKLYSGDLNIGFGFGTKFKFDGNTYNVNTNSVFLETIHGVRLTKYAFVGLGFGAHWYYKDSQDFEYEYQYPESDETRTFDCSLDMQHMVAFPLFVNLKGFYPINDDLKAYVGTSLGYSFTTEVGNSAYNYWSGYYHPEYQHGFYGTFDFGIQWKKLHVGFGLTHQTLNVKEYSTGGDYFDGKDIKFNNFALKFGFCW